jgi:hypothetical protein
LILTVLLFGVTLELVARVEVRATFLAIKVVIVRHGRLLKVVAGTAASD